MMKNGMLETDDVRWDDKHAWMYIYYQYSCVEALVHCRLPLLSRGSWMAEGSAVGPLWLSHSAADIGFWVLCWLGISNRWWRYSRKYTRARRQMKGSVGLCEGHRRRRSYIGQLSAGLWANAGAIARCAWWNWKLSTERLPVEWTLFCSICRIDSHVDRFPRKWRWGLRYAKKWRKITATMYGDV